MTCFDELACRAVECREWRWLPGMLSRCSTDTRRAVYRWLSGLDTRHYGLVCVIEDKHGRPCRSVATLQPGPDDLPDLTDPATLGCLLSLVREAWEPHRGSDYIASTMHTGSGWGVGARYGSEGLAAIVLPTYETEAEALVAALEAAP